jgi:hypothetical protein
VDTRPDDVKAAKHVNVVNVVNAWPS